MTTVYGGCVEPEGMELDDERTRDYCPNCSAPGAYHWYSQRCEGGSINTYSGWSCEVCGESEGDEEEGWG